ncbi:hypothetical protein [Pyxidicoccus caerfyrddinensis]|uniref:hypothetical protein n=1 Tax=Pyxidicoccus caerfyrddinensis TaxID=2709663 RepID=UPI0013DC3660|nr:hypothetical protein [Pyxidicoccus caerfyrddinensis]
MGTMRSTWLALALVLMGLQSACSGRGAEGRGPDSDGDGVSDAEDCAGGSARFWQPLPAYRDTDGDGVGTGPQETLCTDGTLPDGWAAGAGDCDDADFTRWRRVEGLYPDLDDDGATGAGPVTACVGNSLSGYHEAPGPPDCDDAAPRFQQSTQSWLDADRDGVGSGAGVSYCLGSHPPPGYAALDGDCAPDDSTRSVPLPYLYRDRDGDGATVPESGTLCAALLPIGYTTLESGLDCDDTDRTRWALRDTYVDTDGDGFGVGAHALRCMGATLDPGYAAQGEDCAPEDRTVWQWHSYSHRDHDGDGATVPESGVLCTAGTLPEGHHEWPLGHDCDDGNRDVRVSWSLYPDTDGDGVGSGAQETLCAGPQRPGGYSFVDTDCASTDATVWQLLSYLHRDVDGDSYTVPESGLLCSGAALPPGYLTASNGFDCDDADLTVYLRLQAWADTDADGVGAGPATMLCTDGTVRAPWSTTGTDCAAEDGARWQTRTYFHVDRDADGHTTPEKGQQCVGAALPAPYFTQATGNDCDDTAPDLFRWAVVYRDEDADGVGTPPRSISCLGQSLPAGFSFKGYDVDDADAAVQEDEDEDLLVELILSP